jgi:hypothetical protein
MEQMPTKTLPGVKQLLVQAKDTFLKRKEFFMMVAAVPAIVSFAAELLLAFSPTMIPLYGLLTLVSAVLGLFSAIALIIGLSDESLRDWKMAYSKAKKHFWPLIWAAILVGIVVIIGFILLIIPGIYLGVLFGFYSFALVLEGKKGWSAAERSKQLVKGYWWAVFGRWIAFAVLVAIVVGILGGIIAAFDVQVLNAIFSLVIGLVVTPYAMAYSYLVYKSLKSVKGAGASIGSDQKMGMNSEKKMEMNQEKNMGMKKEDQGEMKKESGMEE